MTEAQTHSIFSTVPCASHRNGAYFNLLRTNLKKVMKFVLTNDQDLVVPIKADFLLLSFSEKLKLAFKKLSLFLMLAIISIFIPVLHFILVPLFLLLSIVFAFREFRIKYRLSLSEAAKCAKCLENFKSEYLLDDELRLSCEKCFSHYLYIGEAR